MDKFSNQPAGRHPPLAESPEGVRVIRRGRRYHVQGTRSDGTWFQMRAFTYAADALAMFQAQTTLRREPQQ
jgi:hypothetical protein